MVHSDIEKDGIVERYVRRQLTVEEQQAFEEHFFGCDECFAKLQEAERFQAGLRDAARRGLLDNTRGSAAPAGRWRWAFAAAACAAIVFLTMSSWMYFRQLPQLRDTLNRTAAELEVERQARATLPR